MLDPPKRQKMTIRSIAQEVGVSSTTISRYLNGTGYVGKKTQKSIEEVIKKHKYRPSHMAQSLRRGHSKIIAIISNMTVGNINVEDMFTRIDETDYTAIIMYRSGSDHDGLRVLELIRRIHADGLIVLPETQSENKQFHHNLSMLYKHEGVPCVLSAQHEDINMDCVAYDSKKSGRIATNHLIANGFSPIGCITGSMQTTEGKLRFEGYREALVGANIPYDPSLVYEGFFRRKDGYDAMHHFHQSGQMPRAAVCCNDETAIGVYLAAEELNIRIPEDIAIIGCDNTEYSRIIKPSLSTINFDDSYAARSIVELLIDRIERKASQERRIVYLDPILVARDSSLPG